MQALDEADFGDNVVSKNNGNDNNSSFYSFWSSGTIVFFLVGFVSIFLNGSKLEKSISEST